MHLTLTNVNTHHRNQSKQKCPQKYTTNKHSDFETKLTCHIPRRVTLVFIRFVSFVDCLLPTADTHTKTTRSNSMINVLRLVVHVMITLHTNVLYPDNNDDVIEMLLMKYLLESVYMAKCSRSSSTIGFTCCWPVYEIYFQFNHCLVA